MGASLSAQVVRPFWNSPTLFGSSPVLMAVLLMQLFKPIHFEPMLVSKDGATHSMGCDSHPPDTRPRCCSPRASGPAFDNLHGWQKLTARVRLFPTRMKCCNEMRGVANEAPTF